MSKYCIEIKDPIEIILPERETVPDEDCINYILDDILRYPEGNQRALRISLYRAGLMQINCERTGIRYQINKNFFKQVFQDVKDI